MTMHTYLKYSLFSLLFVATVAVLASCKEERLTAPQVVDGDKLKVGDRKIRLFGVDAPELEQICWRDGEIWPCGIEAAKAAEEFISGRSVRCFEELQNKNGRMVVTCTVAGEEATLNQWMVQEGWALAFRHYSTEFVALEQDARAAGKGIWDSEFVPPWKWRQGTRLASHHEAATGCRIKGNIASNGKRHYHTPRDKSYKLIKVSEAKGERWFCSQQEARAAGWEAAPK